MAQLPEKFLKPYDPKATEGRIYKLWEDSGFFRPEVRPPWAESRSNLNRDIPFSIVLPPPNVTGTLHTGHSFMLAIEDIMVRYNRMQGKKALWIPGTDHAAIATEAIIVKQLAKEKTNKHTLGREEFLKRVDEYAKSSHDTIVHQLKKMGASLDWSREAFTLDEKRQSAVYTAFKQMYDAGLIYRGDRIVNWDPKSQTTVSDDEIEYEEETSKFYYFKYGPFVIGTARPETKFGDKYVVMHPDDARYQKYKHGQAIELEWINGSITATIIKDKEIDMEFGTGVMTITPWHSTVDFEIAERHGLDKEQIIDQYGKLLPIAGEFHGMKISEVREKIVEKLRSKGLVEKVEESYVHKKAISHRGGGIIEPQIMKQWFVDVHKKIPSWRNYVGLGKSLKDLMMHAVMSGKIKILPERFEKIYYHWINNLRDWNISRQIWYGHRIPVWYHEPKCIPKRGQEKDIEKCEEVIVSKKQPQCEFCDAKYIQDQDTLDTWFSSGLWTFSTLGWPEKTNDLGTYHPTSVLETGHDIIFFWVARMILMSEYLLGEVPFKTVYLHGMVLDRHGKKMSKSNPETAVDPLDTIEKYGADALRMAMLVGVGPGQDVTLSEDKIRAYGKFGNKLWNVSRFVIEQTGETKLKLHDLKTGDLTQEDQKYLAGFTKLKKELTKEMNEYKYYLVSEKIYHYIWHTFADQIIETIKKRLENTDEKGRLSGHYTLYTILHDSLILLHPFMPFITEEIWSHIPKKNDTLLMVTQWPQ